MVDVTPDEARLLEEAIARYPATVEELGRASNLRPLAFRRALEGLVAKGMVVLEPLEDVTYVRPMASLEPPGDPPPPDEDDPAYV